MTKNSTEVAIRRILVTLDASRHSLAALEATAELAARVQAELLGLFVEDVNLLQLAGLPFARVTSYASAELRPMDSRTMERALRVQAEQARRSLETTAARRQLRWSFRVVRGEVATEVLAASMEVDLISVGPVGSLLGSGAKAGAAARTVAVRAPRSVLVLRNGIRPGQPVVTVYDGSLAAVRALAVAAQVAEADGGRITVLIPADSPTPARQLLEEAGGWLESRGRRAAYRRIDRLDVGEIVRAVKAEGGGVLVLGAEHLPPQEAQTQALMDELDCPLLVVR
jgi:nucleotide-binding universal stress UspA family protein